MGLRHINLSGYQIETVVFGNKVMGFKVHRRAFFPDVGQKTYELLGEFNYFTDAAKFVAAQRSHGDEKKDQYLVYFLTEIYSEGDDFRR